MSELEGIKKAYDLNDWKLKAKPSNLKGYRLPTLKEWRYTARGGANGENTIYAGSNNLDKVGWYDKNTNVNDRGNVIFPVGKKQANELGIYDMSGNVMEWTDIPTEVNLSNSKDTVEFVCGGSYFNSANNCQLESSDYYRPKRCFSYIGFRLSRTK